MSFTKHSCEILMLFVSKLRPFTRLPGRAPHWQCGGHRFDPAYLHQRQKGQRTFGSLSFFIFLFLRGCVLVQKVSFVVLGTMLKKR